MKNRYFSFRQERLGIFSQLFVSGFFISFVANEIKLFNGQLLSCNIWFVLEHSYNKKVF